MRKSLWTIVSLLFVAFGAPAARADSLVDYTMVFTVGDTNEGAGFPPTGSFVFNTTTNKFTSFTVDWIMAGIDFRFDLTACANGVGEPLDPNLACLVTSDGLSSYNALTATAPIFWTAFSDFSCSATECAAPDRFLGLDSGNWGIAEKLQFLSNVNDGLVEFGDATVVAAEPSTVVLMLFGTGFLLVVRKLQLRQKWSK